MSEFAERMAALAEQFVAQARDEREALRVAVEKRDWAVVGRLAHSLSGRAGLFGFHDLSCRAQDLEIALDQRAPEAELHQRCIMLLGALEI